MKNKLIVIFIVLLSIYFYSKYKKPSFNGAGGGLKNAAWLWNKADSFEGKFRAYEEYQLYVAISSLSNKANQSYFPSKNEIRFIEEANEFFNNIKKKLMSFERQLSPDDIKYVTMDNDQSLYPFIGSYSTGFVFENECTDAYYQEIIDKFGIDETQKVASLIIHYFFQKESNFKRSYVERLIEIIDESEELKEDYGELSNFYYPYILKNTNDRKYNNIESPFLRIGIKKEHVKRYVQKFLKKYHSCFLGKDVISFQRKLDKDLVRSRAKKLINGLKELVSSEEKLPTSIYDLRKELSELTKNLPVELKIIKHSDNKIEILSESFDYKNPKDISYGFVEK